MSTRAVYTFKGFGETYHIYKHYDGYLTGAAEFLSKALDQAWGLPRYEPDEFAAAFVAANKTGAGDIRIMARRTQASDVEYGYTLYPLTAKAAGAFPKLNAGVLMVDVVSTDYWDGKKKERRIFRGSLAEFISRAEEIEAEYDYA
jgi:hypothetical protein